MIYLSFVLLSLNVLVTFAACIIATLYRHKKDLNLIRLYIYYSTVNIIISLIFSATRSRILYYELFNLENLISTCLIYFYFRRLMIRESLRKAVLVLYMVFAGLSVFLLFGPPDLFKTFIPPFYGTTNLFITIPCFFYFYEIFRSDLETNYKKDPSFYVVSAIFLSYGVTMPFYFGYNTIFSLSKAGNEILGDVNLFIWLCFYVILIVAFILPSPDNYKIEKQSV
jgi:hypothetical protein